MLLYELQRKPPKAYNSYKCLEGGFKTALTPGSASLVRFGVMKNLIPSAAPGNVTPRTKSMARMMYGIVAVRYTTCYRKYGQDDVWHCGCQVHHLL